MSLGLPTRLAMALCVGICALLVAAGYLVRTPLFTAPLVAGQLSALATRHGVDLTVNSYRPVGLYGLRLDEVQLTARRGDYLIQADLAAVDVLPSLKGFFSSGTIRPAKIDIYGGHIRLTRRPDRAQSPAKPPPTPPKPAKTAEKPRATSTATTKPLPIHTILHDVSVSAALSPLPGATRPLVVHRADFMLDRRAPMPLDFRHAYGQMPDGVPFVVKMEAPPGEKQGKKAPKTYIIRPSEPTRVDRWLPAPMPAATSVGELRICPRCAPATVELRDLRVAGGQKFRAASDRLSLTAGPDQIRLALAPVTAEVALGAEKDAPRATYQLADFEWVYDVAAHTATVQAQVRDADAGQASISASWSGAWGALDGRISLHSFHTAGLWPLLGLGPQIRGGTHTGEVEASYEPGIDLVDFSLDLSTRDLVMALPLVTDEPLDFDSLGLKLNALLQPRARALSVTGGNAFFGQADPVHFSGYALDAGSGLVFDAEVRAEKLHPQKLRDGLPPTLARLARGTEFDGEFGFAIHTAGHTAFPDGIILSVDFSGEVEVLGDSSYADILSLASAGPPSVDLPGTLVRKVDLDAWINYDALPERIPMVLAAAEDAKFFTHDGFDWGGLRRALAFNVQAGGIKRGGSTLSQQLSKNLFLDHDRTLARKLQEAYVTWRLEAELSKQRIMELYVNVVEWGPGIGGIKQAAQRYFAVPAEELNVPRTALLAAVLPGPSLFGRQVLAGYLPTSRLEKIEHILSNLRFMRVITPADYTRLYDRAKRGWIDDLKLTVCADDATAPPGTPICP